MTKIAFLQSEMRERFGFMYLSAMLKQAGHDVEVFINEYPNYEPDIIGFSSSTPSFPQDLEIAKYCRRRYPNAFIIFGGAHPTFYPEEVIAEDCIDSICIGEGYEAIVELANGNRKEIYYPRPKYDINKLPMPDYALYYNKYLVLRNKPTKQVYIVHGCPYQCSFCWNQAYNKMYPGKIIQCMNVKKAIKEIKFLLDHYGFKWLQFISDNMTVNKKWLKNFMWEYRKIIIAEHWNNYKSVTLLPVKYLMNIRCNEVDQEIVDILKNSGCDRVDFGIEHGNDFIRNDVLKRNMTKEQIINAGKMFNKAGIRIQTSNIVGMPYDALKRSIETVKLNQQFKVEIAKACIYQPFAGTSLYEDYKDQFQNMDINTGTTIQIGHDGRGNITKVKLKDEKKLVRLSYLFDFFVQNKWLNPFIELICSLPLDNLYKKYYIWRLKKQGKKYDA